MSTGRVEGGSHASGRIWNDHPGFEDYFDLDLRAGVIYQVFVQPFDPGIDFDLYVFDENGNVVAMDEWSSDSDAYGTISPQRTGPFRFTVNAVRGPSAYRIEGQE